MAHYRDRADAGRRLATELQAYADRLDVIVLALPRGGVPVAFEIARELHVPLDVFVVRKLGFPLHPEFAMGAIASGGVRVLDREAVRHYGVSDEELAAVTASEERELARREQRYRDDRPFPDVRGRTVILVDDGLATGASMAAAAEALRTKGPARLVAAVPVASPETCDSFREIVDEIVCAITPEQLHAVGFWYEDFSQTTDDEVRDLLSRAGREHPASTPKPAAPGGAGADGGSLLRDSARGLCLAALLIGLAACESSARLALSSGIGPQPALPTPERALIPMVNVAPATGWPANRTPVAALGTTVNAFATGLDHPRWLHVLPNGDVLVAETNAPPKPDDGKGIKGWFFKRFQKKAGGAVPSANRITLLRDADGDGVAEVRSVFLSGLHAPFGMALVGNELYVANSDAVVRFPYVRGATRIDAAGTPVVALPAGTINHHWTKSLIASRDGTKLYVGVGSNSNVAENGMEAEEGRAAIWEIDPKTGSHRVFASGLRNPVGLAWEPASGMLWVSVNERDELGGDLVPDYMTSVRDGAFYGWPYSYYGQHVDDRVQPQRPDLVARAIPPDYALGSHTGSLGLASSWGTTLPPSFTDGMFVGQHGSWNRKPRSGYRVIFVPFIGGKPAGMPVEVLTGFLNERGESMGRPVGLAIDARGALLVADDVGNAVWRVSASPARP
jgi:glucose/arabinose dehydrogenase/predicted phosphoribosyltransferase